MMQRRHRDLASSLITIAGGSSPRKRPQDWQSTGHKHAASSAIPVSPSRCRVISHTANVVTAIALAPRTTGSAAARPIRTVLRASNNATCDTSRQETATGSGGSALATRCSRCEGGQGAARAIADTNPVGYNHCEREPMTCSQGRPATGHPLLAESVPAQSPCCGPM